MLTHRAEQHAGESAVAAAADDEKMSIGGGLDEPRSGVALDEDALEDQVGVLGQYRGDGLVELVFGGPAEVRLRISSEAPVSRSYWCRWPSPGRDQGELGLVLVSFRRGPRQCALAPFGAVDADDDVLPPAHTVPRFVRDGAVVCRPLEHLPTPEVVSKPSMGRPPTAGERP